VSLHVSDAVIWQESNEGVSLYNTETGDFVSLNGTGAQIWVLVASDGEREPVISKLSLLYAGPDKELGSRIGTDVDEFIASMVAGGLLVESAA
jgi:hypothetical protein